MLQLNESQIKAIERLAGDKVYANIGGKNVIFDSQPQILEELLCIF